MTRFVSWSVAGVSFDYLNDALRHRRQTGQEIVVCFSDSERIRKPIKRDDPEPPARPTFGSTMQRLIDTLMQNGMTEDQAIAAIAEAREKRKLRKVRKVRPRAQSA